MTAPLTSRYPASGAGTTGADAAADCPPRRPIGTAWYAATALVVVIGAAVRVWAAQGDFWLDEVWSYARARTVDSPTAVFTQMRHDNNHHLMTLWLYFVGPQENWTLLRLPSLVAGVGSVILSAWIARRWSKVAMLAAAILTASSYVLIIYSSEARGYALAGFFSLAGWLALLRYFAAGRWLSLLSFWLMASLGILSHLTALHFYVGTIIWSAARLSRTSANTVRTLRSLGTCHAVPIALVATFYFVSVRGMEIGGSSRPESLAAVLAKTLALSVGRPVESPTVQFLFGLVALAAGIVSLRFMRQEKCDQWIFFAVTVFISPLVSLPAQTSAGLFVRYFYINIVFFLLLLGYLLGRCWSLGIWGRAVFVMALAAIVAGNILCLRDFAHGGRGQYKAALGYMAENSPGRSLEIATDQKRNRLMLAYYAAYLPAGKQLNYYTTDEMTDRQPEWFVTVYGEPGKPHRSGVSIAGHDYMLTRVFRHAGLSGFDWAVYRRKDRPESPAQTAHD
jgi:hypothetical protein